MIASEHWGPTEAIQGGLKAISGVKIYITDPETDKPLPVNQEGEVSVGVVLLFLYTYIYRIRW